MRNTKVQITFHLGNPKYRSDVAEKANGKLWNMVEENRREQGATLPQVLRELYIGATLYSVDYPYL